MGSVSANTLGTSAIVLGAVVVAACFLDWAKPRRAAGDIRAELERGLKEAERPQDASRQIAHLREAYGQAGTGKPFHGIWVAVLSGVAVLVTMIAASLKDEVREQYGEITYRVAGAVFAIAMFLVLVDASSGLFHRKDRAVGLWLALVAALAAALAATFASARLGKSEAAESTE